MSCRAAGWRGRRCTDARRGLAIHSGYIPKKSAFNGAYFSHSVDNSRKVGSIEYILLACAKETIDALRKDGLECIYTSAFDDINESAWIEDDL